MEETLKKLRDILIEAYTIETATSHTIPDDNVCAHISMVYAYGVLVGVGIGKRTSQIAND